MGLFIAAAITSMLALSVIGGVAWWNARTADRRMLIIAFLVMLPIQPLVFYVVRLPLVAALQPLFGTEAWWPLALMWAAPLTEEPAKWLVLLVPAVRHGLAPANAIPLALSVGLGFGLGEIWFVAHAVITSPNYPDLPFWMFGGFIVERIEVCFLHAMFVVWLFVRLALGQSFWPGALAGIVLHFATNFPIYLMGIDALGIGRLNWSLMVMGWIVVMVVAGVVLMWRIQRRLAREAVAGSG
jgi:hypothetical protein